MQSVAAQLQVVYCGAVFHLLDADTQKKLAAAVFGLLAPGGTFFGRHVGSASESSFEVFPENDGVSQLRFLHTAASFTSMLKVVTAP